MNYIQDAKLRVYLEALLRIFCAKFIVEEAAPLLIAGLIDTR